MAGLLAATIRDWAARPADPYPCAHATIAYAAAALDRPAPELPRARTRAEVVAALRPFGGIAQFMAAKLAILGATVTATPGRGDVGIIDAPMGRTCGLCLGGGKWACKGDRLVAVYAAAPVIAWRIECRKP